MNALIFITALLVTLCFGVSNGDERNSDNTTAPPKQTFKEAEKEVTKFINDQLRSLLPKIVGGAGTSTLSPRCMAGMMKILGNIRRLKGWSIKILDSIGKPSAGILKGTSYSLGHYDQCVDLIVSNKGLETNNITGAMFRGMYCKVRIQFREPIVEAARDYYKGKINATDLGKLKEVIEATPYVPVTSEFMSHFLGVCLPSSCTVEDVKEIVQTISFPGSATVERCEIKSNEELNETQRVVTIIFIVLICLVCASTLIHWLFHSRIRDSLSHNNCRCVSVVVSLSICNSTKELVKNIEEDVDHILASQCVRGIVVASVAWTILGHTYLLPYDAFYMQSSSLKNLQNYLDEEYFSLVVNYPLAIDALFVCYGFIMTYTLWYSACKAQDVKVNVIALIIRNYLRIVIPVLMFIGISILLPLIGSGPFWNDFMDNAIVKCYKNPWAYVGMYSNFLEENEQCFPHLWFASCLAQLNLAAIILCWILSRNMKVGIILVVLLAVAGNITVGIYTYNNNFSPSYIVYFIENSSSMFWKLNYSLPLSHFGPYALGMLTGIFVARRSRHPLKPFLACVGWIICLSIIAGIMLFIFKYHIEPMSTFWSALYASSHRTLFSFSVAWIILACSFGNGGFVNSIFSWRVFDPLFRLSYYAYIFHFIVIAVTVGVSREHFNYEHFDLVLKTISYIAVTYFVSYLVYMILEMPLRSLCNSFCPKKSKQIIVTSLNNINMHKMDNLTPNSTINGSCKLWSVSNNTKSM